MLGTNLQEIIFGTKILQFLKKGKLTESLQSIQNPARLKFEILCHELQHFRQNKAKNHRKKLLEKRVPDLQRVYGITFQIKQQSLAVKQVDWNQQTKVEKIQK